MDSNSEKIYRALKYLNDHGKSVVISDYIIACGNDLNLLYSLEADKFIYIENGFYKLREIGDKEFAKLHEIKTKEDIDISNQNPVVYGLKKQVEQTQELLIDSQIRNNQAQARLAEATTGTLKYKFLKDALLVVVGAGAAIGGSYLSKQSDQQPQLKNESARPTIDIHKVIFDTIHIVKDTTK